MGARDFDRDPPKVRLFVPIISANTERGEAGYVFREWKEAVERSLSIAPRRRFIVPVIVDEKENYEGDLSRYRQIPPEFERLALWSRAGRRPGRRAARDAERRNPCYAAARAA